MKDIDINKSKKGSDSYETGHWATLLDGMKMLWEESPDHAHVKAILRDGIPHAKVYLAKTPKYARTFLLVCKCILMFLFMFYIFKISMLVFSENRMPGNSLQTWAMQRLNV